MVTLHRTALVWVLVVALPLPAWTQTVETAPNAWRMDGVARVMPTGPGRADQDTGLLISDPARREVRLERSGGALFRVPYDRVVAIHYEKGDKPSGLLRRSRAFVVLHHTGAGGEAASEALRFRSERQALEFVGAIEQHTGRVVDRSSARESFLGAPLRARTGSRVVVTGADGETVRGTVASLSPSSLTLTLLTGDARQYSTEELRRIRLSYSPKHDAVVGGAVGAGMAVFNVWLAAGLSGCYNDSASNCHVAQAMAGGAVVVGGLGALIGVTVGSMRYPFNKAFDVYRPAPAGAPARSVSVAPRFGPSAASVSIAVSF